MHVVTYFSGPERALLSLWLRQMSAMIAADNKEHAIPSLSFLARRRDAPVAPVTCNDGLSAMMNHA